MLDAYDTQRDAWFDNAAAALEHDADGDGRLRCARCDRTLTRRALITGIGGRDRHVHTNPAGFTYRMRTFSAAPGCVEEGTPQRAHSWFPPHAWQIANCAGCGAHVGWRFARASADAFYALIDDRLREDDAA